jgi:hypothetical protein
LLKITIFVELTEMSHISMLQDFYPVGLVCNATATNLMGFFYFMYTTQTKIKNGFAVVKVYENKEYWHTYEFPIQKQLQFY